MRVANFDDETLKVLGKVLFDVVILGGCEWWIFSPDRGQRAQKIFFRAKKLVFYFHLHTFRNHPK